jgi:mannose-6-phosphate isomerase-like protein (cupin superfamily)
MYSPTDEITLGSERIAIKLSDGDVLVFEVTMPAGGGPPMLHRHDPFELYHVRSGEFAFYLEGEDGTVTRRVAGPGEVVAIGERLEHTIRNESDDEAVATVVFAPGAPMERFARAAGELGSESPAEVLALAEAHGIEITRPIEHALPQT